MKSLEQRFWEKVDIGDFFECWEWKAAVKPNGYGKFGIGTTPVYAHRMAWRLAYGKIPKGLYVLHHCDNRRCVNPNHLFLGTQRDNIQDMLRKGRCGTYDKRGENNPRSKLTESNVREIKRLLAAGSLLHREIAEMFGVTRPLISYISRGEVWSHLESEVA